MNKSNNHVGTKRPLPPPLCEVEPDLIDLFLVSARQDLAVIEHALACRDYAVIQDTVHRLKGAAMIFRMSSTVSAALLIESVLNAGLVVDHDQLIEACGLLRQQIAVL